MSDDRAIAITDSLDHADREELETILDSFNEDRTGYRDFRRLGCFVRDDDGRLVAGIDGYSWGGFMYIGALWVDEALRGQGISRRLVEAAEAEAATRGCVTVVLGSFDFQAPGFYVKLGYEVVGATEDTPVGHRELLLQKRLS